MLCICRLLERCRLIRFFSPVWALGFSKPRGLKAARKLKNTHRVMRWAQKSYRKSNLGMYLKCNPFEGSSHAKGIVLEKMYDVVWVKY